MGMNPEIKLIWVEALTSGEYKQGVNQLRSSGAKFCCLGVLCELAVKAGVIPKPEADLGYGAENNYMELPREVISWADIKTQNPSNPIAGKNEAWKGQGSLAYMNDNGKTFPEIAKLIEEYL